MTSNNSSQTQSASGLRTMIHELGHALGIGHYDHAQRCHSSGSGSDKTLHAAAVDRLGDHFSVMAFCVNVRTVHRWRTGARPDAGHLLALLSVAEETQPIS